MRTTRAVLAAATALALAPLCVAAGASSSVLRTQSRDCAWSVELDPDGVNALYPDRAARYWILDVPATPGTSLAISGRFPHARYTSLTSYDAALRSADGLPDVAIRPDRGSRNPFLPGASRRVPDSRRHYTVHVVRGRVPAHRAPNTLYTTSSDGTRKGTSFVVALRIYEPDRGLGVTGGVPLPRVTIESPGGSRRLPRCSAPEAPHGINGEVSKLSTPYPTLLHQRPVEWHKFYNLPAAVTANLAPSGNGAARTLPQGGFADNPDNKYVSAVVETTQQRALLITGRLPVTPRTYGHQRRMSPSQLRYWSMCSNELASERFYGCVMDDQLPLLHHRRYRILVTSAATRPSRATRRCGFSWLPAGPAPETVMIERNMLPAPGFHHSIQSARYDHERHDLGRFYPRARYLSVRHASRLRCLAPVTRGR